MLRLDPDHIISIFRMFGYEHVRVREVRSGYRNTSYAAEVPGMGLCNLLIHKPEPGAEQRIRRTNWLGEQLAADNLPVRYPLDARVLRLRVVGKTYHASLYNYLPGQTIPWEAYTMKHIKLLGWALGSLHVRMQPLAQQSFPSVYDEYRAQLDRMAGYFGDAQVADALWQKLGMRVDEGYLELLVSFVDACRTLPDAQVLHMDFVRGNILFDESPEDSMFTLGDIKLTGIIDFEKAVIGHPLFDIARTLAFLIVDCAAKTPAQVKKYFLQSGYVRRGGKNLSARFVHVADERLDVLETAMKLFLLCDYYKFLRANPYESLTMNHHFVRTRDILLESGVLRAAATNVNSQPL